MIKRLSQLRGDQTGLAVTNTRAVKLHQAEPKNGGHYSTAIPWTFMRAMPNRIVPVYFKVDEKLVWDTIQTDLPPLIHELEKLL